MRKLLLLSVSAMLITMQLWAQRTVTGRVTDNQGNGLPNVSIQVKELMGTVSAADGAKIPPLS